MRAMLLAVCVLSASMLARAQTNLALLNSAAGEYIGQGRFYYTTNTADFTVALNGSAIQASAFGYLIMLTGPNNTVPGVGVYSNAVA